LGRLLGISHQAISLWDRVPPERLVDIEVLTGVPREVLRPDLYRGFKRMTPRGKHK
jgi:DNA-binding transcriptional regulator YdaS (Cro superfamily)